MTSIRTAFKFDGVMVSLGRILPTRLVSPKICESRKYKRILASIRVLGLVEPPMVYPQPGTDGSFLLLDGHLRVHALREMGEKEVSCLIATDDEGFTYNHKVNKLAPIQEHFMIIKALEHGVSEERLAMTLNIDVAHVREKRDLLRGICPEAVELLKTEQIAASTIRELRRVQPMRQIEMAELMLASRNFASTYAKCLLAATPQEQLVDSQSAKEVDGMSVEDMARLEREMQEIGRDFRRIEESHGRNVLNLVIAVGYLKRLLKSADIVKHLSRRHHDLLTQFHQIVESTSLNEPESGPGPGPGPQPA